VPRVLAERHDLLHRAQPALELRQVRERSRGRRRGLSPPRRRSCTSFPRGRGASSRPRSRH
jgi:hypothetical protein